MLDQSDGMQPFVDSLNKGIPSTRACKPSPGQRAAKESDQVTSEVVVEIVISLVPAALCAA